MRQPFCGFLTIGMLDATDDQAAGNFTPARAVPVIASEPQDQQGIAASFIGRDARNGLPAPVDATSEGVELVVVRDPAMTALMRRVEDVASSNATVLISGESGTGKELVAAHLHRSSGRRD